ESVGGIVHRSRVGDVYILEDLVNVGGAFGGETCGAWIFPDKSLCPDGVFSALMFLKLLEESGIKPSELGKGLPRLFLTRRKIACPNPIKIQVMESLENKIDSHFSGAVISDIDGIRAEFPDKSWILIRPSGTEPILRITTEAMSEQESAKLAELSSELVHEALEEFTRKQ
ncbi:MAG: hypothetical protein LUP94_00920, partial [Candidatus Methanomethylicus sp.]|nr:hypothetical protein [Candidatus Methanomethylicus sp.]